MYFIYQITEMLFCKCGNIQLSFIDNENNESESQLDAIEIEMASLSLSELRHIPQPNKLIQFPVLTKSTTTNESTVLKCMYCCTETLIQNNNNYYVPADLPVNAKIKNHSFPRNQFQHTHYSTLQSVLIYPNKVSPTIPQLKR